MLATKVKLQNASLHTAQHIVTQTLVSGLVSELMVTTLVSYRILYMVVCSG